jgi:hypothetical protein
VHHPHGVLSRGWHHIQHRKVRIPQPLRMLRGEPELPQPRLYHTLMRDYEESSPRMVDDLDDLDDDPNDACSNMDEWFPEDGSNDRD